MMESAQKKPGFFSGFRFSSWRSEPPPVEKQERDNYYRTVEAGETPPIPRVGFNASPESPAKRASAAQMSSRKILEPPKGPSSKLSNVINSTDLAVVPSSTTRATNFSSSTTPKAPSFGSLSTYNSRPGAYSSATTPRNMFRQSTARDRPTFSFSPRVPYNTMKESFPPATPGRGLRASTAEVNGRALSKAASTNLFPMRVSSPPPELSGEALAKQVPDKVGHQGSVYADEFLAHLVPPGLDDVQRRQWFCILDLRRLKYAADEIFAKKDWKLNILSFAKEYEKSRSMIMLRYGLYEFKTKPSAELEKQWQKSNGIPTSDDEGRPNGSQSHAGRKLKRRAEEELPERDTVLQSSAVNTNKRRATERPPLAETTAFASNKRKVDVVEEPNENHRAKIQKAPSASKSAMDKIFNSPQRKDTASTKPAKTAAQPTSTPKSNPFQAQTKVPNGVLAASASKSAAASGNIFAHLKQAPGSDDEDEVDSEEESGDNSDETGSESQDVSQSDEPSVAVSGGVSTPQYDGILNTKQAAAAGGAGTSMSSNSSEAGDVKKERSLFERISRGSDGQALRRLGPEDHSSQASSDIARPASPAKLTTPFGGGDQTWKPQSSIKFSSSAASPAKPTTAEKVEPAPASVPSQASGSSAEAEDEERDVETPRPEPSQPASLFASGFKPQASATTSTVFEPKPQSLSGGSASSIFGSKTADATASNASSIFAPKSPAVPAANTSSIFGQAKSTDTAKPSSATSAFGQPKADEQKASVPADTPSVLFGAKPANSASEVPKSDSIFQSQTLFGNKPKAEDAAAPAAPQMNLFAPKPSEEASDGKTAQAASVFGAGASLPKTNIFGSSQPSTGFGAAAPSNGEPPAKKTASTSSGQSASSLFANNLFKPAAPAPDAGKALFSMDAKPSFGGFNAANNGVDSSKTDAKPMTGGEQPKSFFGNTASTTAAPTSIFNFGATTSQTPAVANPGTSFGTVATSFNTVASDDEPKFNNPFAQNPAASGSLSFDFGTGSGPASGSQGGAAPFIFGGASTGNNAQGSSSSPFAFGGGAAGSSGPISGTQNTVPTLSFGGDSQSQTASAPQSGLFGAGSGAAPSGGLFSFGGGSGQANGSSIFSGQKAPAAPGSIFNLAPPGGGTSTGTNTPFTFGGASSLATTPATGTPEPGAEHEGGAAGPEHADGEDEEKHQQISLTEGGPGEEDEDILHEVRAKAMKFTMGGSANSGSDSEASAKADKDKKKSPWKVQGVGPFRLLRHKTTGAVRMLLRQEPSGRVAMNKALLSEFTYRVEPPGAKYVKLTVAKDAGSGLETWMLQVKTNQAAQALVDALEANKAGEKKK